MNAVRVWSTMAGVALLAGCAAEPRAGNEPAADINAAAEAAQGDIDTYAANSLQPASTTGPAVTSAPAPGATASVAAQATDSGMAAADVVRTYYGLLARRRYDRAYRLWDDDGRASGLTEREFADSFAKYADYRIEVGPPGRVDAGAGQRYVEVPVRVFGRLVDRRGPFDLRGSVTLHRTADIDGATAAQRQWRIRDSSLKPRPAVAVSRTADYRCAGETRVSVRFDDAADTATLRRDGHDVAVLDRQQPASGIWYKGGGYELRGKGRDADFAAAGRAPIACSSD